MIHLIGAGGHAKVVLDALLAGGTALSTIRVRDGRAEMQGRDLLGASIETPELDADLSGQDVHVAIGAIVARAALLEQALVLGAHAPTLVHPSAQVSRFTTVGGGTFVAALAIIGPSARVGRGVIVNHGAVVDHDCVIGDHCHIAPNASLGGGVKLGARVLIGAGAVVLPGVSIGDDAVIGAGAVVTRDAPDYAAWVGIPAAPNESRS
jgi:sugar O-acyltransferase (sialic acid O-acetyltransferase NeuD family)